ncbi:urokinase plasminogen activator surface receptor isoform X2 [Castor canadensis]|uniref:Urokinase plasminogen activator surface receptor n=1 Tax=Castor canadensis TaxID=51338 RepID=A0A8C0XBD6_CASCN|nr:urokinase plasminogen activator surface receptor isoform X2 [Castor canadensis]
MGRALMLLLSLLWTLACIPASWGLQCIRCESSASCREEECAPGHDLCRTTVLRVWEEELEVVERGCAHPEKTNRTLSYRTDSQIISLTENVCAGNLCNRPRPVGRGPVVPLGRYLECSSCTSADKSCERGREQTLQCRSPREQCLELVTHHSLEGSLSDENHIRGCGILPGCPGPTGFHNNHTFHYLQCCNSTKCNRGPVLELEQLPPNGFQCYSCEGNSTHGCSSNKTSLIHCQGPMDQCLEATGTKELQNPSYTVRGCATASWCQGSHVADTFRMTQVIVSCCSGSGCNRPVPDGQFHSGGASQPGSAYLSLTMTLLMTARLWGDIPLWI